jgi:hypothetical protein
MIPFTELQQMRNVMAAELEETQPWMMGYGALSGKIELIDEMMEDNYAHERLAQTLTRKIALMEEIRGVELGILKYKKKVKKLKTYLKYKRDALDALEVGLKDRDSLL